MTPVRPAHRAFRPPCYIGCRGSSEPGSWCGSGQRTTVSRSTLAWEDLLAHRSRTLRPVLEASHQTLTASAHSAAVDAPSFGDLAVDGRRPARSFGTSPGSNPGSPQFLPRAKQRFAPSHPGDSGMPSLSLWSDRRFAPSTPSLSPPAFLRTQALPGRPRRWLERTPCTPDSAHLSAFGQCRNRQSPSPPDTWSKSSCADR